MTAALRILIVGGYGIFGGRLVELLEDDARLTLRGTYGTRCRQSRLALRSSPLDVIWNRVAAVIRTAFESI
jgi:hypothetical protein